HTNSYIGVVNLRVNGQYDYSEGGLDGKVDRERIFFMQHPSGTFKLEYLNSFGPTTLLESIHGHQRVARVAFRASDGAEASYYIACRTFKCEVTIEGDEALVFNLHQRWDCLRY